MKPFQRLMNTIIGKLFPTYKINPHDLDNQPLYLNAERLNFDRGRRFWLDCFKFVATSVGIIIAFFTLVNQASKESQNLLSREFLTYTERIPNHEDKASANAIVSMEIFSVDPTPWYLRFIPQDTALPYINQATNVVAYNLTYEAQTKEHTCNEKWETDTNYVCDTSPTFIEKACVDALSRMNSNLTNKGLILDLSHKQLQNTYLSGANLERANLRRSDLLHANLSDANLNKAEFSDSKLLKAKLTGAELNDTRLRNANLSGAKLNNADLSRAELFKADLAMANLSKANLSCANLNKARLTAAILTGANLHNTNLSETNLFMADLSGTDLSEAKNLIQNQIDSVSICDQSTRLPKGLHCRNLR